MSLEKVDIKIVNEQIYDGKLVRVDRRSKAGITLEEIVINLEKNCGDVSQFAQHTLFLAEQQLTNPEYKDLKRRWDAAIRLNTKIRMDLLRCRALDMLENYENKSPTSSAPDIAYCKTLLTEFLAEGSARARARYAINTAQSEEDSEEEAAGEVMEAMDRI